MRFNRSLLITLILAVSLTAFAQTESNNTLPADLDLTDKLFNAISEVEVERVRLVLDTEKDLTIKRAAATEVLYQAVWHGNFEIVRLLLEAGADPNDQSDEEKTPALWGMSFNITPELVQILIDYGARANLTTKTGVTVLMITARWGNPEVAQLLIDNGAPLDAVNSDGDTALMYAASEPDPKRSLGVIRVFLKAGANPNLQDEKGETALISAATANALASEEEIEIVKILLEAGADPNLKSRAGETALTRTSNKKIIKLLKRYGAKH